MILKRQGYFREMLLGTNANLSIHDFVQEEADINEEKIINYLATGVIIVACGGVVTDVINPDKGFIGVPDIKTDGMWVWSGDLEYYVRQYHLKLNDEFVETMKKNDWKIKKDLVIEEDNIEIID